MMYDDDDPIASGNPIIDLDNDGSDDDNDDDNIEQGGSSTMATTNNEPQFELNNPPEIGETGCFENVITKQLNPPTQNSKFVGYQVRKQEEAAKTTKTFAFGRFF